MPQPKRPPSNDNCIFCRIAKKEISSKIVFEDREMIAFEDIRPQAPVHILVIPKRHIEGLFDLSQSDIDLIGKLALTATEMARKKDIEESGYRLVINCNKDAGQDVFHLHLHLLGGRKFTWPPG